MVWNLISALPVSVIGSGSVAMWPFQILSAIPWFLAYLWIVGLAYRSRNRFMWIALLFYMIAGTMESAVAIEANRIFLHGSSSRWADLPLALAFATFFTSSLNRAERNHLAILTFLFAASGMIYTAGLLFPISQLSEWTEQAFQVKITDMVVFLLPVLDSLYFLTLAVTLVSFPFRKLTTRWKQDVAAKEQSYDRN